MLPAEDGDISSDTAYNLLGTARGFRVNSDQTFTPIITVTAQSQKYLVTYTWTLLAKTWDTDGGPPLIALKTEQVNVICGHEHVQGFRTENDQDRSQVLYHYAVITVGTDDEAITNDVTYRMDQIGQPGVFAAIDKAWNQLVAAGAS
jgi:hypothetical protein